jgi:threonyl-tRNA synthetase
MLILGERELESQSVSVRYRDGKQENGIDLAEYAAMVGQRIDAKASF